LVKAGPTFNVPLQPETVAPQATPFVTITQQQQHQANQQKSSETHGSGERRPPRVANDDRRERRTSSNFNQDGNSQLFLGNLPTRATEDELRQMFSVFGKIVDLRIHTKTQKNGNNSRPVPNYGFITFEDPASAVKLQEATVS
jgi:RNA recognition motif-containing protein